jgi:hypothetical protein
MFAQYQFGKNALDGFEIIKFWSIKSAQVQQHFRFLTQFSHSRSKTRACIFTSCICIFFIFSSYFNVFLFNDKKNVLFFFESNSVLVIPIEINLFHNSRINFQVILSFFT